MSGPDYKVPPLSPAGKVVYGLLAVSVFLAACSDPIDQLIPEDALKGALFADISITGVQTGKSVKGGMLVMGVIITPRAIQNSQIKPTALAALKAVKKEYPDAEWLNFFIVNDKRMYECDNWVAIAEYKEGAISVKGGLPGEADIQEWNAMTGKAIRPMRRPTEEDLQLEHDICVAMKRINDEARAKSDRLREQGRHDEADKLFERLAPYDDEAMNRLVAKRLGVPYARISQRYEVQSYYLIHSGREL